jgi:hypothetical protein
MTLLGGSRAFGPVDDVEAALVERSLRDPAGNILSVLRI